jgi:hypothetical protein
MYYEGVYGGFISVTGGYELYRTWFPYSRVYYSSDTGMSPLEKATAEMMSFLQEKAYLDVSLDIKKQQEVMEFIHALAQKYGQRELGFGRNIPQTHKPALKYFGLDVTPTSKHAQSDQVIHTPNISE